MFIENIFFTSQPKKLSRALYWKIYAPTRRAIAGVCRQLSNQLSNAYLNSYNVNVYGRVQGAQGAGSRHCINRMAFAISYVEPSSKKLFFMIASE
jgi:hypothetical protein